ncbi:tRNA pseudouridine55 synthase [Bacillus pakistanensis]|uniref:tRNA pseudouridine synthase B n=1 Tax=Rossellomorea pakistanensis TaxID=992288 RepID=A0ABS2NGA0_9BACI|nr:tRNA pseudouridine(55) synthase TruB [Bacillus pakistanensis]MBM7586877.1 tRNA pseudouridine55 synthase [Bacillus pakistanensis]
MDGILPLWKPKGLTSHDCVFKVRKLLKMKKVGHTGTLDPDVTGVLPICLGRGTKIAQYITDSGKSYEGEVTLGFSTTTEDASGELVEEKKVNRTIMREEIMSIFNRLEGEITQVPPMFSAVKVNGKRLYEYARQGIEVERPSRVVQIKSLTLLDERQEFKGDLISFKFRVSCSKGTYIRTLAVTIGEKLGIPAHMSGLTRVQSASFTEADCVTLEEIQTLIECNEISKAIFPIEDGLSHLPKWEISDTLAEKVKNGARLELPEDWPIDEEVVMMENGKAIAIYHVHPEKEGTIKPVKVLYND